MLVMALLLGVTCAVAQGLSALLARSTTSAVLSYLTVFALTIGTLIVFGLATALTTETVTRTVRQPASDPFSPPGAPPTGTEEFTYTATQSRTDRVWWLVAPNPFVVLADAAPALPERRDPVTGRRLPNASDPLGEIGRGVRTLREPPEPESEAAVLDRPVSVQPEPRGAAVWPFGLAVNILLGAGALVITTRRLRTPVHAMPKGLRVA